MVLLARRWVRLGSGCFRVGWARLPLRHGLVLLACRVRPVAGRIGKATSRKLAAEGPARFRSRTLLAFGVPGSRFVRSAWLVPGSHELGMAGLGLGPHGSRLVARPSACLVVGPLKRIRLAAWLVLGLSGARPLASCSSPTLCLAHPPCGPPSVRSARRRPSDLPGPGSASRLACA